MFLSFVCRLTNQRVFFFLRFDFNTQQDKNKYATPKYRLVVRFSNKNITCQVVYSTLTHDVVVASAYSKELPDFGLNFGLTNYAAAYCTGLLIARRILTKLGLADAYKGLAEASGEDYLVEENEEGPRPFFCLLDVGLKRTSTGSKVFAALKGALDGGLDIPHSDSRYVGGENFSSFLFFSSSLTSQLFHNFADFSFFFPFLFQRETPIPLRSTSLEGT